MTDLPASQETTQGRPRADGPRVLIAGVGNIFLADDGFGPAAARRLALDPAGQPAGVRVMDYGIRGLHLAYDLLDGVDALVLLDAVPPAAAEDRPGSLRVLRIGPEDVSDPAGDTVAVLDPHGMDPASVFGRLRSLGGELPPTVLVGCVVADTSEGIGLTPEVEAAIPAAISAVRAVLAEFVPSVSEQR